MKSILFYFLAGTLLTEGCSMGMHVVKQDELVKIYSRESILPHGYGDQVLEFKGKRYKHFFGAGYVRVTGKDMLLFVTSKDGERKTLHAVPIGKGEEIEIDLGDTSFGSGLGYPKD